jgi:hypothetical protein
MQELHSWQLVLPSCALIVSPQTAQEIAALIRDRVPGLEFLITQAASSTTDGYLSASAWDFVNYPEALDSAPNVERLVADRTMEAARVAELAGNPHLCLAAVPLEAVHVPTLFSSQSAEVLELLRSPPSLRQHGFDLFTGATPENITGQLQRTLAPGWKILEFWRDGFLSFVADGSDDFLCWASRERNRDRPLRINQLVLLEATLQFADLAGKLLKHMTPRPGRVQFSIALRNMVENGKPVYLGPGPLGPYDWHGAEKRPVPEESVQFQVPWSVGIYEAGQVAFKLVSRVYEWFGFDHGAIPYCYAQDGVGVVRADAIVDAVKSGR